MRIVKSPALWIFLIQLLLICVVYQKVLFQPSNFYTSNQYDGIRSLYAIQVFVEQEGPDSWSKFQYMNHPYGENTVFAVITPGFALPIKALYTLGIIPVDWVIPAYFWLVIISIPISASLIFLIGNFLFKNRILAFTLSLTLPWINYQIHRLQVGHFELSLTCFLLLNIWCLIMISQRWFYIKKQILYWTIIVSMILYTAFIHMYLSAIMAVFTSLFCLAYGWFNRNAQGETKNKWISSLSGGFYSALAFAIIMIIFAVTDPYASERKPIPNGYNWVEWNAQFSAIFTSSHGEKIKFPLSSTGPIKYEMDTYLGSFALYGLLALGLVWLFRKKANFTFPKEIEPITNEGKLILSIFVASLISLFISFGDQFYLFNGEYIIHNYFNLFFWIKKVYPKILQFRTIGRFNFFFFWGANFLVAYLLIKLLWNKVWGKGIIAVLLLFSLVDFKDRLNFSKQCILPDNFFVSKTNNIPSIDYTKYQSIFPIPYYIVGNEDYNITIDPEDNWNTFTYYVSYHSKLPLMASKMPRSSLVQARAQISLLSDNPDRSLIEQLRQIGKPILVVYNPNLPRVEISPELQPANTYNNTFSKFIEKESKSLTKISTHNGIDYYAWEPWLINVQ